MALRKRDAFIDQSIQMGRIHVWITQRGDRVEPLLVRDDEDNVGTLLGATSGLAVHANDLSNGLSKA